MTTQQVEMSLLSAAETAIADSHAHTPVSVIRDTPSPQVVDEKFRKDVVVVELKNIHKTYLLGIEGVPALRYILTFIPEAYRLGASHCPSVVVSLWLSTEHPAAARHRC